MTKALCKLLTLAVAICGAACTVSRTPAPPLSGPSELGLSLATSANPEVISQDGASTSQITIQAFDANGQPAKSVALRAEIMVNGVITDFGTISAHSLVTGGDGKALVVYTAPASPLVTPTDGTGQVVSIRVTPASGDSANSQPRYVDIRLVPPGVIQVPGPTPNFEWTPVSPTAFSAVTFDGLKSTAPGGATIASYRWDFDDGAQYVGNPASHQFPAGTHQVTLTVVDSNGFSGSASKFVSVGAGVGPTADFTFSPTAPTIGMAISFNGGVSKASTGHAIVRWDWFFGGIGATQTGTGVTITKKYEAPDLPGTYNVTLTVTDEVGQTGFVTKTVTVAP